MIEIVISLVTTVSKNISPIIVDIKLSTQEGRLRGTSTICTGIEQFCIAIIILKPSHSLVYPMKMLLLM